MSVCPRLQPRFPRFLQCLLLSMGLFLSARLTVSPAQVSTNITPDNSPVRTAVTQNGRVHTIAGGTVQGTNLFHSFDRFDVGTGDTARFTGPDTIANILSRVTGGHPSNIDGRIRSTIPDANLYLLNPSGVIFGPNASLDVRGSFHVSTADFLRFADGATFSANLGEASMLTIASPAAFGFLRQHPAGISIQGSTLQVSEGKTLSLIGGDIVIAGSGVPPSDMTPPTLGSRSGQLHLVSVASPGEVPLQVADQGPALRVDPFTHLGEVTLSDFAVLDTSGDRGGTVVIRGGRLHIDHADILADTKGDVAGAGIGIDIEVRDALDVTHGTLRAIASSTGSGDAGAVTLKTAGDVTLTDAVIFNGTFSSGAAGVVTITAADITVTASSIFTGTIDMDNPGPGGAVNIMATGDVILTDGSAISSDSSFTTGQGGTVTVAAGGAVSLDSSNIRSINLGSNEGGTVTVTAREITLTDDAFISTDAFGSGAAGSVTIRATDVTVADAFISSGASLNTSGAAGAVTIIATGDVTLRDEAFIESGTFGSENAGVVTIAAKALSLTNGAIISADAFESGTGGTITVTATDLTLTDGAIISTETFGSGNAGNINLNVSRLRASTLEGQELVQVSSSSRQGTTGDAGTVTIQGVDGADSVVHRLSLQNSQVLTETAGSGKGGDIRVRATEVTLSDEAVVSAAAAGPGQAGNVTFTVMGTVLLERGGRISTSTSGAGSGGTITVHADQLVLDGAGSQITADTSFDLSLADLAVSLDILHTFDADVEATLMSPSGTPVLLFSGVGGAGDNFTGTRLDDRAETSIEEGSPPFAGTFRPTEPLAQLIGEPISGTWVLTIGDRASGDQGTLQHWSLELGGVAVQSRDVPQAIVDHNTSRSTLVVEAGPGAVVEAAESLNKGGDIQITVRSLAMRQGATLSSSSMGTGAGGTVRVTATEAITIAGDNSGVLTRAADRGRGGDITLHAGTIQLAEGAVISAQSSGAGNAGSIRLAATDTFLSENSAVTAAAEAAGGGNLALEARLVRLIDSVLTAEAMGVDQQGSDGGNVTIQAGFVILDHSQIQANAFGGNGGNIVIAVEDAFLADTETCEGQVCLDASSQLGVAGIVEVSNPTADLSGVVTPLPQTFTQAAALLPQRCAERLQGQPVSTFVLAGRDSVPAKPGAILPSPLYRAEREVAASTGRTDALLLSAARAAAQLVYMISLSELDLACAK